MEADVRRPLEEVITVPREGDGVAAPPTIGNRLEIRRISVALEDPSLGTSLPSVGLFVSVYDRKLVLKLIPEQPLIGR
jgi:hypothetical protein